MRPAPENSDVMILYPKGSLDSLTAAELEKTLNSLIAKKINRIIVNLSQINYISSAGWGIFTSIIKQVRSSNGDLKLSGITKDIQDIAELLGIPDLIPTYRTDQEAVQSFSVH